MRVDSRPVRSSDPTDESCRLFDGLFEAIPDALVAIDVDGLVVRANERAGHLFSRRRDDLLGTRMEYLLAGRFREALHRAAFVAGTGNTAPELEICGLDPAGGEIPIDVTIGRLDVSGTACILLVMREVSDRLATEERLNALSRAKDEFVATVSHELRTPLTAILGFADILCSQGEDLDAPTREELLAGISEQSTEAAGIIEDLLVAARADIGEVSVSAEEVDLGKEVRTVLASLAPDRTLHITFENEEAAVRADPSRVRQIIRNLISNSFRYGGPEIRIRIRSGGDDVTVQVEDNGAGVSQDEAEQIFEPYHHTHDGAASSASVGLGLTVSRQLARLMDGDLTYARSNGWSIFRLSLPKAGARVRGD